MFFSFSNFYDFYNITQVIAHAGVPQKKTSTKGRLFGAWRRYQN